MKVTTQQLTSGRFALIIDGNTEMCVLIEGSDKPSTALLKLVQQHDDDVSRRLRRINAMVEAAHILQSEGR